MKKKVKETVKVAPKATTPIIPIDILLEECNKAIVKEIAKDFHEEAKEIISLSSIELRKEFLDYHKKDQGNICCLVLDKAKRDLVAEGKLVHKPEDAFGKPFML
jgi:hypothetical protein